MKIIYELDTEKDSMVDIERMSKSLDMALALNKFSYEIRGWVNHDERESIPSEEISDRFYAILEDYGLTLDNLIE